MRVVIDAAETERDRLLLRVLWATGVRISEALALRPMDVYADSLVMPNRKNSDQLVKRVYIPAGMANLPGELLVWAQANNLANTTPLFLSHKPAHDGALRAIGRKHAWGLVKAASRRADVAVLAMRPSRDGPAGEPAPIHPHLFRHSRVRQNLRSTRSLPIVQKQAGWATLQPAYLKPDDEEVRSAMRAIPE